MSFENIFTHGNLVDVNVSVWTAARKLHPEDLGLTGVKIPDAFSLGHKKLMPAEVIAKFKHMDYLARRTLDRHSFSFEFGGARFVPKKRWLDFSQEMDKLISEFNQLADDFAKNYNVYRLEMRMHFVQAAHDAYKRARKLCGFRVDENDFVNAFIERLDGFYPDASCIREKFRLEYNVFQVSLPDLSRASYEDLAEESEKIKMMEQAYQRSLQRKVENFVDRITREQREKAHRVLESFSNALSQGKMITEASMTMVRNMIDDYRKMDIVGDDSFVEALTTYKSKLIDGYKAHQIRQSSVLKKAIVDDLSVILSHACDKAVIDELAKNYRSRIDL